MGTKWLKGKKMYIIKWTDGSRTYENMKTIEEDAIENVFDFKWLRAMQMKKRGRIVKVRFLKTLSFEDGTTEDVFQTWFNGYEGKYQWHPQLGSDFPNEGDEGKLWQNVLKEAKMREKMPRKNYVRIIGSSRQPSKVSSTLAGKDKKSTRECIMNTPRILYQSGINRCVPYSLLNLISASKRMRHKLDTLLNGGGGFGSFNDLARYSGKICGCDLKHIKDQNVKKGLKNNWVDWLLGQKGGLYLVRNATHAVGVDVQENCPGYIYDPGLKFALHLSKNNLKKCGLNKITEIRSVYLYKNRKKLV